MCIFLKIVYIYWIVNNVSRSGMDIVYIYMPIAIDIYESILYVMHVW